MSGHEDKTRIVRIQQCGRCIGMGKLFTKEECPDCEGLGRLIDGDPERVQALKNGLKGQKNKVRTEFKFGKKSP